MTNSYIYTLKALDKVIDEKEKAAREAAKVAREKRELLHATEVGEVPEGALHCDDALNKGNIRIDGPYGTSVFFPLRTSTPAMLKAMCAELTSQKLAAEAAGMEAAYAEGGHSLEEWIEDLNKCLAVHADKETLKNEYDAATASVFETIHDLCECCAARASVVSNLPKEVADKLMAEAKVAELWEKYPETKPVGETASVVALRRDIPDDLTEEYFLFRASNACQTGDEEDEDEYEDEDEEEEEEI